MRIPQILRSILRSLYIHSLYLSGAIGWARSRLKRQGVVVLTFHRVLPDAEYENTACQRGMMVRARTFDALLAYLRRECECVPVALMNSDPLQSGRRSSRLRVALTFDDGWRDNYETALPLARKHGVPFTVFLCPGLVEGRSDFWPLAPVVLWKEAERSGKLGLLRDLWASLAPSAAARSGDLDELIDGLKKLDAEKRREFINAARVKLESADNIDDAGMFLSWEQVTEMAQAGVSFGSHTDTHQILTRISTTDAWRELQESKTVLESRLKQCALLAYPNGDWSETVRTMAGQCGYKLAFANSPGVWRSNGNQLSIPRLNIWEGKLTGKQGRFSEIEFEYATFWKAYRALLKEQ